MTTKKAAIPNPASSSAAPSMRTTAPGLMGKGSRLGGMSPRASFANTPMNTDVPPTPLAGAMEQKSIQPPSPKLPVPPAPAPMMKVSTKGNEADMTTMGVRPLRLQDMLKTAMAQSAEKVNVSIEAERQTDLTTKVAEKQSDDGTVDHEYALKLAEAIEFIATELPKEAAHMTENKIEPGKGPGALHVMEAESSERFPEHQGQGHNTVPMHTGMQKSLPNGPTTQVPNDKDRAPGGPGHQTTAMSGGKGKTASIADLAKGAFKKVAEDEKLEKKETDGMAEVAKGLAKAEEAHEKEEKKEGSAPTDLVSYMMSKTKTAEDAINPAQISAGAAVPPDTSAAGESGGEPVGGAPQGPSSLVSSNQGAIDYKRNQAYAPRKGELKEYFSEPALTMSTDKTLAAAFDNTAKAGTKFASAGVGASTKVAAARAVLSKLAEEAEEKKSVKDKGEKKEKDSNYGC